MKVLVTTVILRLAAPYQLLHGLEVEAPEEWVLHDLAGAVLRAYPLILLEL